MANQLTSQVVADIKRVADKMGVPPHTLTKALYFSNGGKYSDWQLRVAGGFQNLIKAHFIPSDWQEVSNQLQMKNKARANQLYLQSFGTLEIILQKLQNTARAMPKMQVPPKIQFQKPKKVDRIVTIVLSDHHIGSDILSEETGRQFGPVEEARALACIAEQVVNYKTLKRSEAILHVLMLGDMIENQLHGPTSADLVHLQACRAIWLYPQLLTHFASAFKLVRVFFAVGNHGRDKFIHPDRATALKFNAIETTIYFALRQIMSKYHNIEFYQPLTPWVEFPLFHFKGYATHGDTHINVGNPGKTINIAKIENQINRINASLKDTEEYKVFVMGHVHQPLVTQLTNGSYLILNGALVPPNAYAQSINITEAPQVQVLWEATPDHPVGDARLIDVKGSERIQSLDKIIKPFKGL